MKKIISLLSAVAMLALAAVPASAALNYQLEGSDYVIYELPTKEEVAAYAVNVDVEVSDKAADDATLTAWGGRPLKTTYSGKLDQFDVYKVTYTATGIGTLVMGWDGNGSKEAFFGLYSIMVSHDGKVLPEGSEVTPLKAYLGDGTSPALSGAGVDKGTSLLNIRYTRADATAATIYPAMVDFASAVDTTGKITMDYVVAVPAGSYVEIPFVEGLIDYKAVNDTFSSDGYITKNFTAENVVLGELPPPPPVLDDIIVTPVADAENKITLGKAWDVNFKYDTAKAYTATFTDLDEADEAKKTFVAELDFGGIAEWENGSRYSFVTLLKTTKTNVELAVTNN